MKSEIQAHADFSSVRYANCWEDADILISALEPEGRNCISIGSAGDNSFSLLAAGAKHVTITEMNPAQVACIKLRIAAYKVLTHSEFLTMLGETDGERQALFEKCLPHLDQTTIDYWKHFSHHIEEGFGRIGKFESYFTLFRNKALPLVHSRKKVSSLLAPRDQKERYKFYDKHWNTWRWKLMFKFFFSRFTMGRIGRDPAFFKYVKGSVADRILMRAKHALTHLNPAENPYLNWILTGKYNQTLTHALRAENYDKIRANIDRITIDPRPVEAVLTNTTKLFDAYNLSDIFEYMSEENTEQLLKTIHRYSNTGARLAYWNMLAPRSRPESLSHLITPLSELSNKLFQEDKAFFYSAFIIEETL